MKKIGILLSIILSSIMFSGCFNDTPKCGDKETIDLVKQIAKENKIGTIFNDTTSYEVNAIRTRTTDKQKMRQCVAQLEATSVYGPSARINSSVYDITYTVELTDDGKQFYVEVLFPENSSNETNLW